MVQTNFRASDMGVKRGKSSSSPASAKDTDESKAAKKAAAPEPKAAEDVPTGTINEVKDWVGDDKKRAKLALDAEKEKDSPRSTLVDFLNDLIEGK